MHYLLLGYILNIIVNYIAVRTWMVQDARPNWGDILIRLFMILLPLGALLMLTVHFIYWLASQLRGKKIPPWLQWLTGVR